MMSRVEIFTAIICIILIYSNICLWGEVKRMKKVYYNLTLICLELLGGKDE